MSSTLLYTLKVKYGCIPTVSESFRGLSPKFEDHKPEQVLYTLDYQKMLRMFRDLPNVHEAIVKTYKTFYTELRIFEPTI